MTVVAHHATPTIRSTRTAPNVLAVGFELASGTTVTIYRSTPGQTAPRMQMQIPGGNPVDCGFIDAPERFGSYQTPAEFEAWVKRFATHA